MGYTSQRAFTVSVLADNATQKVAIASVIAKVYLDISS
jgi:ribonuclease HII